MAFMACFNGKPPCPFYWAPPHDEYSRYYRHQKYSDAKIADEPIEKNLHELNLNDIDAELRREKEELAAIDNMIAKINRIALESTR